MMCKLQSHLKIAATFAALTLFATIARGQEPMLVIDSGGHSSTISDVIFTRDGRRLISAGTDKVVRVWNVETGQVERTIRGEIAEGDPGKIYAAALSPDKKILALGGWLAGTPEKRDAVRLHDFETGEVLALLEGHDSVIEDLAFSPDGRLLASASFDNTIRLWNVGERRQVRVLEGHHGDVVYGVAFSADGKRLASAGWDKTLRLWEVASGRLLATLKEHQDQVLQVAFSPDGRFLASGGQDGSLHLRDAQSGALLRELPRQDGRIATLAFSPDSTRLLAGGASGSAELYALPGGDVLRIFRHDNLVSAGTFSRIDGLVATAGGDNNVIELWQAQTGQRVRTLSGGGKSVWSVAFRGDGGRLALGQSLSHQNRNQRGPLETAFQLVRDQHFELAIAAEPPAEKDFERAQALQGNLELTIPPGGDGTVLQINHGSQVQQELRRNASSGYRHNSFSLSRDGQRILSGAGNGRLTLYGSTTGAKLQDLVGHTSDVWAVAVSPDNRLVASGSLDQTVRLWSLASGQLLVSIFLGKDREWVAWTPKGYYTASARGDRYIGWQINHGVDKAAEYFPVEHFQKQYYRPDVVNLTLELRDPDLALTEANRRRNISTPAEAVPELPPQVIVISPENGEHVGRRTLKVVATATSSGSPLTELAVALNGRVVNRREGVAKEDPRKRIEKLDVELEPGRNVLTFTASTARSSSLPEERIVYLDAAAVGAAKPSLAVLAVGISDYTAPGLKLQYADDDARAVAVLFKSQEGKAFSRVSTKVLDGTTLVNRDALLDGLDWLQKEAPDKDTTRLLFLSGHGELDKRGKYYFLAQDHDPSRDHEARSLLWQTLVERLTDGDTTSVLILDSCHAAASLGSKGRGNVNITEQLRNFSPSNLITFSASSDDQISTEKDGNGIFTKALLEGLRNLAADGYGGRPKDGKIEARELDAYLLEKVGEASSGQQRPSFHAPFGLAGLELFRSQP